MIRRHLLGALALPCALGLLGGCVEPRAAEIVHVGTAADDVIVVVIETPPGDDDPSQEPTLWQVDTFPAAGVGRWSYPWDEGSAAAAYPITMRHHVYLQLPAPLEEGRRYVLSTPYGETELTFAERATLCESIHVNQVGYHAGSTVRFANLGIYLGDLGPRLLTTPLPYDVVEEATGSVVLSGEAVYLGDDTGLSKASGEHVYRLDLASLPPGGPYFAVVRGFGRSHPFGVGPRWSAELAYVHARGLYHQRCGIALESPYTNHTRGACHETVQVTDAEPPGFISLTGPSRSVRGGYHDAGDFDRRPYHTLVPAWMLNTYEAFPDRFADGQLKLPESGNGIPDWLDEALWGLLIWEELQEADGGVRGGTEADRHPAYAEVNAETDTLVYRTFKRYGHTTASAAGLFAHAARLVRPFDAVRSAELLQRAEAAWGWVEANDPPTAHAAQRAYATLQLYLATEDPAYHDAFRGHATYLMTAGWPEQYYPRYFNLPTTVGGMVFSPYFFSYLTTALPTDDAVRDYFRSRLQQEAASVVDSVASSPYPLGPATAFGWGNVTTQGRYADPVMLMYRLTGEQVYLDTVSQLADYSAGLNPIGKCYTTGLGANPPPNPLQLDSYYTAQRGLGPVPGLTVYGPSEGTSGAPYQVLVWERVYPAWGDLPEQRRYSEGWSLVNVQEFDTTTVTSNPCMYAFLNTAPVLPDLPYKLHRQAVTAGQSPSDVLPMDLTATPHRSSSAFRFRLAGEALSGDRLVFYVVTDAPGPLRVQRQDADVVLTFAVAPELLDVSAIGDPNVVRATFTTAVEETSATRPGNYAITGGVTVAGGTLSGDGRTVTLATSTLTEGVTYTLTASGVRDVGDGVLAPDSRMAFELVTTALSNGLVARWKLDDGVGTTAVDGTGNGHDGTLVNGAAWAGGRLNGALAFDGVDDYLNVGSFDASADALSLSAWFQSSNLANCPGSECRIFAKGTGLAEQEHYWMLSTADSGGAVRLRFRLKTLATTSTLVATSGDVAEGPWMHAAAVYDGATMTLYLDGVEVGRVPKTGSIDSAGGVSAWLGGSPLDATSRPWSGALDDVRVYRRALLPEEVELLATGADP